MELPDSGGGSPHGSTVRYCGHLAMVNVLVRATTLICYNLRAFRSLILRANGGCGGVGATPGLILGAPERTEGARTVARNPWVRTPFRVDAMRKCYRLRFLMQSSVFMQNSVVYGYADRDTPIRRKGQARAL